MPPAPQKPFAPQSASTAHVVAAHEPDKQSALAQSPFFAHV
jgi:hypothetical protein